MEQQARCPTCGTFDHEWESGAEPWTAAPRICQGCVRVDRTVAELKVTNQSLHGTSVRLYANGN